MTTRTNVGAALGAVESNVGELIRRNNKLEDRVKKLEEVVDIFERGFSEMADQITTDHKELERVSADLDVTLADLDAITAEE